MNETELLPTFSPSDNDLIAMALAMPYEKKIEKSIALLQHHEPLAIQTNIDGYNLRFSGGKDSIVIKELAIMSGIKFKATYSDTTIDPPELVDFINKYHNDTEWKHGRGGMKLVDRAVEKRNLPTRRSKWCCSEYKDCCSNSSCELSVKILGVRVSESAKRMARWKQFLVSDRGDTIVAPIVYWTDSDVWRFIKENNLPYCELYDQGWTRLGCIGCPINPESQKREFARWPEYEKMWKDASYKIWEISQTEKNTRGEDRYWKKFKTPEEMWQWWITGDHAKVETNCVFEEMMENT